MLIFKMNRFNAAHSISSQYTLLHTMAALQVTDF